MTWKGGRKIRRDRRGKEGKAGMSKGRNKIIIKDILEKSFVSCQLSFGRTHTHTHILDYILISYNRCCVRKA